MLPTRPSAFGREVGYCAVGDYAAWGQMICALGAEMGWSHRSVCTGVALRCPGIDAGVPGLRRLVYVAMSVTGEAANKALRRGMGGGGERPNLRCQVRPGPRVEDPGRGVVEGLPEGGEAGDVQDCGGVLDGAVRHHVGQEEQRVGQGGGGFFEPDHAASDRQQGRG